MFKDPSQGREGGYFLWEQLGRVRQPNEPIQIEPSVVVRAARSPVRAAVATNRRDGLMTALAVLSLASSVVVGCDASRPTRPEVTGAPSALILSTPEVREMTPTEFPDPCTGEMVQGTLEVRYSADVDDQTPHITLHMKYRFTGNGVVVVTDLLGNPLRQLTGTSYNGSGEHNEDFNDNLNSEKFESTITDDFRIFATNSINEPMDDFTMHANTHVTMFFVPLPPRITAQVTNVNVDCK